MTNQTSDRGWSPEERALLDRLPQEREPGPELAERVVAALRERGRLRRPRQSPGRHGWALRLAAAVGVFLLGAAAGTRWSAWPLGPPPAPAPAPETVQRTGSEYVAALVALASLPPSAEAATEGREAALSTLRGAAERVALLPGQDPEAARLLLAVRELHAGDPDARAAEEDGRWF